MATFVIGGELDLSEGDCTGSSVVARFCCYHQCWTHLNERSLHLAHAPLGQADASVGSGWIYELKLDGYCTIAFKSRGQLYLRSRNDNDFVSRYSAIAVGLQSLPDDTVIDGEVVATQFSWKGFACLEGASERL